MNFEDLKGRTLTAMIGKIIAAVFVILVCAVVSMALFPPGNVLRQISLVVIWYLAGACTVAMLRSP